MPTARTSHKSGSTASSSYHPPLPAIYLCVMKANPKLMAAVKIWIVIFPSITLFQLLFGQQLAILPLLVRNLVLTIILVPWMVFGGLPLLEKLLRQGTRKQSEK